MVNKGEKGGQELYKLSSFHWTGGEQHMPLTLGSQHNLNEHQQMWTFHNTSEDDGECGTQ